MFANLLRFSNVMLGGATLCGALCYLHGFASAVTEELDHLPFSFWLDSASSGFFVISLLAVYAGLTLRYAEDRLQAEITEQRRLKELSTNRKIGAGQPATVREGFVETVPNDTEVV